MVSYAVQYKVQGIYSRVSDWSKPYIVENNACLSLFIGVTDQQGRTRLIFMRFGQEAPELVGIIENESQGYFKDIDRDLYNAASNPNNAMLLKKVNLLVAQGANVSAVFERGKRVIHAAVESAELHNAIMPVLLNV